MKNSYWREGNFPEWRLQIHEKELIKKMKRRKKWSEIGYGWDDEGIDLVIFRKNFRSPSDAKKEVWNIDPEAEYLD